MRTTFVLRGYVEDTLNNKVDRLCNMCGVKQNNIQARPFTTDESQLFQELKTAASFLMPSHIEGFGLTGLDAIAAGIPLMVSQNSGLGEVLTRSTAELPGNLRQIAGDCVFDVQGDEDATLDAWVKGLTARLSDCKKAFSDANDLRNALKTTFDWRRAAEVVTQAATQAMQS